jgi:hypothetical protein
MRTEEDQRKSIKTESNHGKSMKAEGNRCKSKKIKKQSRAVSRQGFGKPKIH